MQEVPISQLKQAVEGLHSCTATHVNQEHVTETFQGETVWDGDVYVFALEGHPKASVCYAWSAPVEGSERRRFFAVLQLPPVVTPRDAVRASIVEAYRDAQDT